MIRSMNPFLCIEGLILEAFVRVHGFVRRSFSVASSASGCSQLCLQSRPAAVSDGGGLLARSAENLGSDPGQQLGPSGRQRVERQKRREKWHSQLSRVLRICFRHRLG